MVKKLLFFATILAFLQSCVTDREIPEISTALPADYKLIHYWDFNNDATLATLSAPTYTTGGASFTYAGSYYDSVDPGSDLNLKQTSVAGKGLRLRNPSGDFVMKLPTTGFSKVVLTYAVTRSSSGAQIQDISYSTDGTNFKTDGLTSTQVSVTETYKVKQLNFSSIPAADNNPNFKIKIKFSVGSDATTGNSRLDNISLEGIGNPVVIPPVDNSMYLLHYWHFNNLPSGTITTSIPADVSINSTLTSAISYDGTGAGYADKVTPGSDLNARNSVVAGDALRLRNPSDTRMMIIAASTKGYKNIVLKYATEKSSATGAGTQTFSYTIDGTNYITTSLPMASYNPDIDPNYSIVTLDLSTITGINNNPNFKFKINFSDNATGSSGNNRFDNVTIEGKVN